MADPRTLCRLLQLASPMLPIGAYGYSQGLETAIEDGIVTDAAAAGSWIADVFHIQLTRFDLPILYRMHAAVPGDWNALLLAGRDTAETHAETRQAGYSLGKLLGELESGGGTPTQPSPASGRGLSSPSPARAGEGQGGGAEAAALPLAFARAARAWGIGAADTIQAYAWSWAENQVAVAMKCVPIGQVAAQRILLAMGDTIAAAMPGILALEDDDLCNFAPGLSIVSSRHETQYSRLFRS